MVIHQPTNGKDFLDLPIKGIIPDICILDMRMPEMDGYETIKVIKLKWLGIKIIDLFNGFQRSTCAAT
jgi:DNA-binding NarL/FixJ family response regulator